jgi:hypothetical protein
MRLANCRSTLIVALSYDQRMMRMAEILGFNLDCKVAFLEV